MQKRYIVMILVAVAVLLLSSKTEWYDRKNFRKHGDWYCPDGYTWGTGEQTGNCCKVGTDLGAPKGQDNGNCIGAVQKQTTFEDAKAIVKNWCLVGSSVSDIARNKPEINALTKDPSQLKELNRICEESRAKMTKGPELSKFKRRSWKLCPNVALRQTRPRKIAGMCCNPDKTGCLDAKMFGATDGIASAKSKHCPKDKKPSCDGGVKPRCDRPSKGEQYQWFCPSEQITYYQDTNKGGGITSEYNEVGKWYDMPESWQNKISSVVIPRGRRIQIFQYAQTKENGGDSAVLGPGTYNLTEVSYPSGYHSPGVFKCDDKNSTPFGSYTDPSSKNQGCWNDSISSIKVLA